MGLRFRKSITLCKGVKLNLSNKSASVSVGRKGIHQSISTTGRTTTSIGIPGTGVSYQKSFNLKKGFANLFKKGKKEEAEAKADPKKKDSKKDSKVDSLASAAVQENTALLEENKATYDSFVEQIEYMRSLHKVADEPIDWKEVFDRPAPAGGALASLRSDSKAEMEEWKTLHEMAEKVLAGDVDAYLDVVDEMRPYDDILEYGSDFEVGTDDPKLLEVEFRVKSEEVVPPAEYVLDAKGNLKEKELSKTAYFDLVQDYVCSCILRIARDSFALLPVEKVLIHAVDTILNTATGQDEEITIVSVAIDRAQLEKMNFERLDPSDAVNSFPCKMSFKKTKGFEPVARLD